MRPAIYVPFPQAVPNKPVIDRKNCTYYIKGKCKVCEIVCPTEAIRFDQEDEIVEVEVGAIVLATGFTVKQPDFFPEYGYGKYADVITDFSLNVWHQLPDQHSVRYADHQMERFLRKLYLLPVPDHAILQKEFHTVQRYAACILQNMQCYISIRYMVENHMCSIWISGQEVRIMKNLCRRAIEEDGVNYIRGRVSRIYEKNGKLIVKGVDTLLGAMPVEIEADMVVLATAGVANEGAEELAQKLHVSYDPYKFFAEAHPKLKPVETNTAGIFLAGACQAPEIFLNLLLMASGAAVKVAALFSQDELTREPLIAVVNRQAPPVYSTCVGCFLCAVGLSISGN